MNLSEQNKEIVKVILVDINDNTIGESEKMKAHEEALLHRAVSVFIINSKKEWLLQCRALEKYHSGGLWSNTCCTHPLPGESATDAALRRLEEEMGMTCKLEKLFHFIYKIELDNNLTEHELDHVFIGVTDERPQINTEEVMDWKYLSVDILEKDIENNLENYTYWFRHIFKQVSEKVLNYTQ